MKKLLPLLCCLSVWSNLSKAQNVGIGTNTPNANAMLDISGINKGLLIPRGDVFTRVALNNNTGKGLMIYDTTTNTLWIHNGNGSVTGWNSVANGNNYWQPGGSLGTEIHNTNTGGFWSTAPVIISNDPGIIQPPVSGAGTRLMWIPQKSAFRMGTVTDDQWDAGNIGTWSVAMGVNTKALGNSTFASGNNAFALGGNSIAMGTNSRAVADASVALGFGSAATGFSSTAIGLGTVARATYSTAVGVYNDSVASSYTNLTGVGIDPIFYVGNGTSATDRHNAMVVYKNGDMIVKNKTTVTISPASFTLPITGAGTRMMWIPEKSAFRVGTVDLDSWDAGNIGLWSFASGHNTIASGEAAVAMGTYAIATGNNSLALGFGTHATGPTSTCIGYNSTASGNQATVLGISSSANATGATSIGYTGIANGQYSTVIGYQGSAFGNYSICMGEASTTHGEGSVVIGSFSTANADHSYAMGYSTYANGQYSTAIGYGTNTKAYGSLAIGMYNDTITASSSRTTWVATDPLVIVGNGTNSGSVSNAAVIYKNGDADLNGYVRLGESTNGSPRIKVKKLTINTPGTQGAFNFVAHGVTQSKILSVSALATVGIYQIIPNHDQAGFKYTINVQSTNIAIGTVAGNSANILNMPVVILVTYEE